MLLPRPDTLVWVGPGRINDTGDAYVVNNFDLLALGDARSEVNMTIFCLLLNVWPLLAFTDR